MTGMMREASPEVRFGPPGAHFPAVKESWLTASLSSCGDFNHSKKGRTGSLTPGKANHPVE